MPFLLRNLTNQIRLSLEWFEASRLQVLVANVMASIKYFGDRNRISEHIETLFLDSGPSSSANLAKMPEHSLNWLRWKNPLLFSTLEILFLIQPFVIRNGFFKY